MSWEENCNMLVVGGGVIKICLFSRIQTGGKVLGRIYLIRLGVVECGKLFCVNVTLVMPF